MSNWRPEGHTYGVGCLIDWLKEGNGGKPFTQPKQIVRADSSLEVRWFVEGNQSVSVWDPVGEHLVIAGCDGATSEIDVQGWQVASLSAPKHQVLVLWGKDRARTFERLGDGRFQSRVDFLKMYPDSDPLVSIYEFDTEAECLAFREGAREATGWEEHLVVFDDETLGEIRQLALAYCGMHPDEDATYLARLPVSVTQARESHSFVEGDLDELVHTVASQHATDTNNAGVDAQMAYLYSTGLTLDAIRKAAAD